MRALDRKLLRDLWHLRGQAVAIALVVACGVATVVTLRVGYESLLESPGRLLRRYRFADVFAALERAPESLRAALDGDPRRGRGRDAHRRGGDARRPGPRRAGDRAAGLDPRRCGRRS